MSTETVLASYRGYGYMAEDSEFEPPYDRVFLLLRIIHTGSGTHPAYFRMETGGSLCGGKAAGA
jgi:hypothetical protein